MSNYVYLFRGNDQRDFQLSQNPTIQKKWKTWVDKLDKEGHLVGRPTFTQSGRIVRNHAEQVIEGPFLEGKEVVGGYVLVEAKNMEEAVEFSKECPLFDNGGSIEVREVQPNIQFATT